MHKDRFEGGVRVISGRVKGLLERLFGDPEMRASGKLDEVQGTIQHRVGRLKDHLDEEPRRGL